MPEEKPLSHRLGEWASTAICGNDILSTTLYVSGLAILFAGVYAPVVFLLVAVILYLYKTIYTEVVEALPINGGAYNCLLNSTSKTIAAIAGVTTFLSYIATAVISAKTAVEYINTILPVPIIFTTIVVLAVFALLVISGIKDSSKVAMAIFVFHILSLFWFVILGCIFFLDGHSRFAMNINQTSLILPSQGGLLMSIFLAFSTSLLGISGFEASSDFVEHQKRGVFRKTLRNMLIGFVIFNPLVALVVLNTMDYAAISHANNFLLAQTANVLGGKVFQFIIVLDSFLVLSGAVLASYISVSGILARMSADGCMPGLLGIRNNKGSYPVIIIVFFVLCCSILLLTRGNLLALAGVYTIAFLGVMTLFAAGNLILKETRRELRRTYRAPTLFVVIALIMTIAGIFGNIKIDGNNLLFFVYYFIPLFIIVFGIIYQNYVLKSLIHIFRSFPSIRKILHQYHDELTDHRFVAFVHNNVNLYKILHYIDINETARNIILVHCICDDHMEENNAAQKIEDMVAHLQQAGAFANFKINVMMVYTPFGPGAITEVARELNISRNKMLIGSIHNFHPYDYSSLGGVRVIF